MKVTIDIDCTPEEARRFLGLPDVSGMNDAMMKTMQEGMQDGLKAMDPETLFKTWVTGGVEGWEKIQKAFWSQMTEGKGEK